MDIERMGLTKYEALQQTVKIIEAKVRELRKERNAVGLAQAAATEERNRKKADELSRQWTTLNTQIDTLEEIARADRKSLTLARQKRTCPKCKTKIYIYDWTAHQKTCK